MAGNNGVDKKRILTSLGIAEVVGVLVAPIGLIALQKIMPRQIKSLYAFVAKHITSRKPELFEKTASLVDGVPDKQGVQPDNAATEPKKSPASPEQKAEKAAQAITDFAIGGALSLACSWAAKRLSLKAFNVEVPSKQFWQAFIVDEAVKLGAIISTVTFLKEPSKRAKTAVQNTMAKVLGMEEDAARSVAGQLIHFQVPEVLGFAASTGTLIALMNNASARSSGTP